MKVLKIIFVIIVSLVVLLFFGLLLFLKFYDINKNLPEITNQLSKSIGRKVLINHGNLSFDLLHGISADFKVLTISDEVKSTARDFIVIDHIHVNLDITALLFKQEIRATDIQLNDIQVTLEPYHFVLDSIRIKVSNFSLKNSFEFKVLIKAYSKESENVEINGQIQIDLNNSKFEIKELKLKTNLNQWDWSKIKTIASILKDSPIWLSNNLNGVLIVESPIFIFSAKGIEDFVLNIQSQIGSGDLDGHVDFKMKSVIPKYNFDFDIRSIKVEDLIQLKEDLIGVKAVLNGQILGFGESFDPNLMMKNLDIKGEIKLNDLRLERLNILKTILNKLDFIPGLANLLQIFLPSDVKDILGVDLTIFNNVRAKIHVSQQKIFVEEAQMESKHFIIKADGEISFDLDTNLTINSYLTRDLSVILTEKNKLLRSLLDEHNYIFIPGKLTGKMPSTIYFPDKDYIMKKVVLTQGSEQLDKILDKNPQVKEIFNALLGDKSNGGQSNQDEDQKQDNQGASKKLITNLFQKILN